MILFWILGENKFKKIIGEKSLETLNDDYNLVNDTENKSFPDCKTK